jgi:translation elongation factor P/translation initiation factor 5A
MQTKSELEEDFEQYAAEQQQAREKAKQLDNNRNVNKLSNGSTVT